MLDNSLPLMSAASSALLIASTPKTNNRTWSIIFKRQKGLLTLSVSCKSLKTKGPKFSQKGPNSPLQIAAALKHEALLQKFYISFLSLLCLNMFCILCMFVHAMLTVNICSYLNIMAVFLSIKQFTAVTC